MAGLALGLAALGNLLVVLPGARLVCGALAALVLVYLVAKLCLFPGMVRDDMTSPFIGSVAATFFMTLMQLATYLAPVAPTAAVVLWWVAVAGHATLVVYVTLRFMVRFKLANVFPTLFITYVGFAVAATTAGTFGLQLFGHGIFWFSLVCYMALMVLVTVRCVRLPLPEPALPSLCIYAAPTSLLLAAYLGTAETPNLVFALVLLALAQTLLLAVAVLLPKLLRLPFYPSYAAMTFPFVISATALGGFLALLSGRGVAYPQVLDVVLTVETAIAALMVLYVLVRYMMFLVDEAQKPVNPLVRDWE